MTEQESTAFDSLIAAFDYPVVVVTTRVGKQKSGCLVGFATQISIEPRRFLVCISKQNHTFGLAMRAHHLAVHLLDDQQTALAALFGAETGDEMDKFAHCDWHPGPGNLPILDAASGYFCGRILERHDFGDHVGMVLAPAGVGPPDAANAALRYSATAQFTPGHSA